MNKKILYISSIVATLGFVSCDDYLDTTPDNRTVLDSEVKVKELLTSAYPEGAYGLFTYAMSDDADDKGFSENSLISNEQGYFWKDFTDVGQDSPAFYWDACYKAISHANTALEFMEKQKVGGVVPEKYQPYYGEALVIRAYCHFMLVNIWGKHYNPTTSGADLGIPYVTEVEKDVFKKYKRETVAKNYEQIEKDLVEGLKYIQDGAYDVAKYHFNRAAAYTFASRYYLYKGNDWQKVVDYSTMALGTNPAAKLRDLSGRYRSLGLNEQLAEYSKATDPANFLLTSNVSYWFYYFQAKVRYAYTPVIENKILNNIFVKQGGNTWCQNTASFSEIDKFVFKWGYFFKRFDANSDNGYFCTMTPVIEAEEALFNRMEANAMLGNYPAVESDLDMFFSKRMTNYTDANKVSESKITAAYENNSKSDSPLKPWYDVEAKKRTYLNCIIDTRRREFYYEGLRWFDIRRFNLKVIHNVKDGAPVTLLENDARKTLQIPVAAQQNGLTPNAR